MEEPVTENMPVMELYLADSIETSGVSLTESMLVMMLHLDDCCDKGSWCSQAHLS